MKVYAIISCTLCKCEIDSPNAAANIHMILTSRQVAMRRLKSVTEQLVEEAIVWDDEPYNQNRVKETITTEYLSEEESSIEYRNGYDEPVEIRVRVVETNLEETENV